MRKSLPCTSRYSRIASASIFTESSAQDSGEIERLTLKDGFAFILFKKEASVALACKLDGTSLNGLNLRVAPRKEKPPEVAGDVLLDLDMKKFRHEKHPKVLDDVEDFLQGFECVGSFSQDKKESNSIVVPGMLFCQQLPICS